MLKDFLKRAVEIVVGKQAEEIAILIYSNKPVNEFNISKKLNMTINQTRNILYKLADYGLVSSMRKKDKKKGWYTYFWKIEVMKTLEFLKEDLLKKISQFEEKIKSRESKQFFVCERCVIEFTEENALLRNFTCPECGGVFSVKDNSKVIREMTKHLDRFKKELKEIDLEIANERERLDKIRGQEIKVREKENKKKKEEAAIKRKKTREAKKVTRIVKKKIIKKKVKNPSNLKKKKINKKIKKRLKK